MDHPLSTEDQEETRLLANVLALILDEEAGQAGVALESLRQQARNRKISGETLKTLFKTLVEQERKARTSPEAFQDELRQELHEQQNALEALTTRHRQLQRDYTSLQEENTLLRQNNAHHRKQIPFRRMALILTFLLGSVIGIAITQLVHTFVDPPRINPALCLH
ncbi:hypothetical protein GS501_06950 [Saccharibacter sp. 17.LH.SD]|uniref:hypothetical protein n=1 Tax=Saccharibacter sp. 17.LH.SD TaxID=2689393 RepID=UPI00136CFEC7|nr:hypothetical protein [Saccharibacter sp. 17.LH.SD]MXV44773.1 hypothetical protein [Saccharibacter sp. 17.LH.SD]